jgi:hypothetical protein
MKWWFSDYDGTINVNHNDIIEQQDLEFINEWIDDGNKLVIATGANESWNFGSLKTKCHPVWLFSNEQRGLRVWQK